MTLGAASSKRLQNLIDDAFARPGCVTEHVFVGEVKLTLRASRCPHPIERDGKLAWVKTLDVVNIYNKDCATKPRWIDGELDVSRMKRGCAAPVYAFLEKICEQRRLALRIECVISSKLRNHYIEKCGFVIEGHGESRKFGTSVIKILESTEMITREINE